MKCRDFKTVAMAVGFTVDVFDGWARGIRNFDGLGGDGTLGCAFN